MGSSSSCFNPSLSLEEYNLFWRTHVISACFIILSYPSSPKPKEKFGAYFGKLREDSESSEWREWSTIPFSVYLSSMLCLF